MKDEGEGRDAIQALVSTASVITALVVGGVVSDHVGLGTLEELLLMGLLGGLLGRSSFVLVDRLR